MRPSVLVIVGPTGSGKSALALRLARAVGGEIVSFDSQQVYQGMDIGTSKPTLVEQEQVPHHMIDVAAPNEEMTAARFAEMADAIVLDLSRRRRPILLCGGTGLYERALLYGLCAGPPADPAVRAQLAELDPAALRAELVRVDPAAAARIEANDRRRTIRALEVWRLTGIGMSVYQKRHEFCQWQARYHARVIGLNPPREQLYRRINDRVQRMIEEGWLREVQRLREGGYAPPLRSQSAIGYAELHAFLEGKHNLPQAIEVIQRKSRHYARRQLSWYRRDPRVEWYGSADDIDPGELERYLTRLPPTS